MTMIEIPLKSAEINGDRGTISLPIKDVLEALERDMTCNPVWDDRRCTVFGLPCVMIELPDSTRIYTETYKRAHKEAEQCAKSR